MLRACHDDARAGAVAKQALLAIVVGGLVFGAVLGARTGPLQVASSAIKLPVATLLALAVSGPLLAALAAAVGRRLRARAVIAVMLTAGARGSLVLLAASPVLLVLVLFDASYFTVKLAAVVAYAAAGRSALGVLVTSLGRAPGRALAAGTFALLYLVAFAQSAWVLRPFLGRPDLGPVPLVATGHEGGAASAVLEAARGALGGGAP